MPPAQSNLSSLPPCVSHSSPALSHGPAPAARGLCLYLPSSPVVLHGEGFPQSISCVRVTDLTSIYSSPFLPSLRERACQTHPDAVGMTSVWQITVVATDVMTLRPGPSQVDRQGQARQSDLHFPLHKVLKVRTALTPSESNISTFPVPFADGEEWGEGMGEKHVWTFLNLEVLAGFTWNIRP